jgi:hypothetical protein
MDQLRQKEGFALEPAARLVIDYYVSRQDFQRDVALQALIAGAINDAHSSRAKFFDDAIPR